ncbi:MAG TPA: MurR/RpiR family transcriptional regulator [Bacillota bacterium]
MDADLRRQEHGLAPNTDGGDGDDIEPGVLARIREAAPRLSPARMAVAEYIVTRMEDVAFWSAARLAQAVGVSESVVVRLAGELGYRGYPELQREVQDLLRRRLQAKPSSTAGTAAPGPAGVTEQAFRSEWRILEAAYRANPPEALEAAAALIVDARHNLAIGMRMGHALAVATGFSLQLLLGNASVVTLGADTLEDSLRACGPDDVAILFDFRPYNDAMRRVVEVLALYRVRRIAVSDAALAPICRGADVVLRTPTEMEVGAGRSLVGGMALIDALGALVWELDPKRCRASMRQMFALRLGSLGTRMARGSRAEDAPNPDPLPIPDPERGDG